MRTVTVIAIASTLLVSCTEQETEPDAAEEPTFSQFTSLEGSERDAAWSPDGQWVVFGGGPGSQLDLWKMPASGGGEVIQLTSGPAMDVFPAWSPDGTQIAFSSNREGSINLWTVPAAGGEPTRIRGGPRNSDSVLSWSPTSIGRSISYEHTTEFLS
jgi:Tol biopolymer transport system component